MDEIVGMIHKGENVNDARAYLKSKQITEAVTLPHGRTELEDVFAKYYEWGGNECDFYDEIIPGGILVKCWVGMRDED